MCTGEQAVRQRAPYVIGHPAAVQGGARTTALRRGAQGQGR